MTPSQRLRERIDQERDRLRVGLPAGREAAALAVLRARERLPRRDPNRGPDLVAGTRLVDPGGNLALSLCLAAPGEDAGANGAASGNDLDGWADGFLAACGCLAEAEMVLTHVETGFMRLIDDGAGRFAAWIAAKGPPSSWRERADTAWWADWLARRQEPDPGTPDQGGPNRGADAPRHGERGGDRGEDQDASARLEAKRDLAAMAWQATLPPEVVVGGCSVRTYRDVLASLITIGLARATEARGPEPVSEQGLMAGVAADLDADPEAVARAIDAFALDRDNVAWHAAVPGIAAAPLVRLGPDRIVLSPRGLTTEPLLFLFRELRRRFPTEYNNVAHHREDMFRQDLYRLFPDKRFVTSSQGIDLRRAGGDLRTDVDAVVFDRKTGTLGVFALKAQDPFARSAAEAMRQRDNLLQANRQIAAVLDWLNRHGPDALLARVDPVTAKRFRVQKVLPFVLGRYLAHAGDGAEQDRRAFWGSWPQVLRLLDGRPFNAADANPLAALAARLGNDVPLVAVPAVAPPKEIPLGDGVAVVYPSYAELRAAAGR
jgi:hypothetical protein